jgi:hypothetical protein
MLFMIEENTLIEHYGDFDIFESQNSPEKTGPRESFPCI